ncbi:MAG: hypothetical protein DDT34_01990 [Firmicutes bacterium]|nr:hypothetical protein [Bacillota bacterium]
MFIREVTARNREGRLDSYIQLVHNEKDPRTGYARARVLYGFGKKENLDLDAVRRLVTSLSRLLPPGESTTLAPGLSLLDSRSLGAGFVLDHLWRELGIRDTLLKLLADRGKDAGEIERSLFSMVANRAIAPSSKLAIEEWARYEVALPGVESPKASSLYRAMDFLLTSASEVEQSVFWSAATLLNLELDIIFFDTTSSYFEIEFEDDKEGENAGPRRYGHGADKRSDLPRVKIGMAVTREGIPVKVWSWSGETSDKAVVAEVKRELTGWRLGRLVWVMDRGMSSEENGRILQEAGHHFIVGARMLSGTKDMREALEHSGRYETIEAGLRAKEVTRGTGAKRKRLILVYSDERAERDRRRREEILDNLRWKLVCLADAHGEEHTKAVCALTGHKTFGRYIKLGPKGKPLLDRKKIAADERRDGKYLLWTSDDTLSIRDVVLGYKGLSLVERAWRDMKHVLDLRPMYHRLADRIRSHVLLCWLGLLLIRVIENRTKRSWHDVRGILNRLHLVRYAGPAGVSTQTTEFTHEMEFVWKSLNCPKLARFIQMETPKSRKKKASRRK